MAHRFTLSAVFLLIAVSLTSAIPVQIPVEEIEGPVCIIVDTTLGKAATLSPARSKYNVLVTDGLAQLTLYQLFVNNYGAVDDIAYVFPLPHDGSVHAMEMAYKDSVYKAEIYKKEEAQTIYDSVTSAGGKAAMLMQSKPNVFKQHLANIPEGDSAEVMIKITMPLKYNNGIYELAIPTMVAARYQSDGVPPVESNGLWNPPPDREGQRLQINVLLQTGYPITGLASPTHPLTISQVEQMLPELTARGVIESNTTVDMPHSAGALLQQVETYPNKDFVLRFSRGEAKMDVSVASTYDESYEQGYFYCTVFPDTALLSSTERKPMDIVLLVDISGSQGGWPLEKEKEISTLILNRLLPEDQFSLLSFNTQVTWCFEAGASVAATSDNVSKALTFIDGLSAGGGTNLLAGVQSALGTETVSEYDRYFVFLTDGFITNEEAILEEIRTHPSQPTIFTFGAGDNLNRYFLDESARIGNGYASEVTSMESSETFVNDAWNKMESPQLSDVVISFNGNEPGNILTPAGTRLYRGAPLIICGTYSAGGAQTLKINGNRDGEEIELAKEIVLSDSKNASSMLPQVWARHMIRQLRIEEGTTTTNKDRIIELSMQYQVLSTYTAFLAYQAQSAEMDMAFSNIGISAGGRADSSGNIPYLAVEEEMRNPQQHEISGITTETMIMVSLEALTIKTDEHNWIAEVRIYDLKGRCVYQFTSSAKNLRKFTWDGIKGIRGRLPAGNYLVSVRSGTGIRTQAILWR